MTESMRKEARDDPTKWLGCIEVGMPIMHALFKNHVSISSHAGNSTLMCLQTGKEKCLSCKDATRGQGSARFTRPDKSAVDPDTDCLSDCGCPISMAALELWLTKVNSHHEDAPRRHDEHGKIRSDMALNPTNLKLFELAIQEVSGHTAESLLQKQEGRLMHTVDWAVSQLAELSPKHRRLAQRKLKEMLDVLAQAEDAMEE